jgi:hypothetical protein
MAATENLQCSATLLLYSELPICKDLDHTAFHRR